MTNFQKLRKLLSDLFELEQDLDFGVYRVLNQRREEISEYLDHQLMPQVEETLRQYQATLTVAEQAELEQAIKQAENLNIDPDTVLKVQALKAKVARNESSVAVEEEVFSCLYDFFSRYYVEGDFISQPYYKKGVYAVPYEGEEIKHYWANDDQYYVKTSERFRDYTFRTKDRRLVKFRVIEADTGGDNNKLDGSNDRRFALSTQSPVVEDNGQLTVSFTYQPGHGRRAQDTINKETVTTILAAPETANWLAALTVPASERKDEKRTLLERYLTQYTKGNTFDYFIHKHLEKFLRRELDFYVKAEVMHLDDIEEQTAPRVEQYLGKVRAIRRVATKIILLLAQLEEFQRKLWLKRKFVTEVNYCVTLDRVPGDLYTEIAANEHQVAEWQDLLLVDEISVGAIDVDFLKSNPHLVLDTKHFPASFKDRLLSAYDDLDSLQNGLVVHGENFQALTLLRPRWEGQIGCVYIDPPYNKGNDGFLYKDSYRHSSWLSMMQDRLRVAEQLLSPTGVLFASIDENERTSLEAVLNNVFSRSNRIEELIWLQNTTHNDSPAYSTNHEYVEVYCKDRGALAAEGITFRGEKPGYSEMMELIDGLSGSYPPVAEIENAIKQFIADHKAEFRNELEEIGLELNEETEKDDPWIGIYNYKHAEYRDDDGRYVPEEEAASRHASIWVWRESDASAPAGKQSPTIKDCDHPNFRFYKPPHPVTGKPCRHPKTGFRWPLAWHDDGRECFNRLARDHRIAFGEDEKKIPQFKRFIHDVETNVPKSVFRDYTDGEKELTHLMGNANSFPNPKPTTLPAGFIEQATGSECWVLDFFAGSGTTAHSVITLNRHDHGHRKYILVESASYVDTILLPRLKKVIYSQDWRDGRPVSRKGSSHFLKYIRLESYDDTLNNLRLNKTAEQQSSLAGMTDDVREQYLLSYMLDIESRGSQSLLTTDSFSHPFQCELKIATGIVGEPEAAVLDLVETFNYLLGLRVKRINSVDGMRIVEGTTPDNKRLLVVWRDLEQMDNDQLDDWFKASSYGTAGNLYDLIYVNGDCNLQNLRSPEETWTVHATEAKFHSLMFDEKDA